VVVQPLELGEQDPRPAGPRRDDRARQRLHRLRIGHRVGDRADAAGPLDQRGGRHERAPLDELLETAVDEEEPRIQVEHALANRREPEVARLDDPGVDGADGELVDALPVDLERHEVTIARGRPDTGLHVLAEGVVAPRPALVEHEATRVRVPDWHDPQQVTGLALVPMRGRNERGDRCIGGA
jgi:hypothetical protein